jgi:hypothetical protein
LSRHDEAPSNGDCSDDLERELERLQRSDYYKYVQSLAPLVKGKVVRKTTAGRTGFLLHFTDGSWAASFLEGSLLRYEVGTGVTPGTTLAKIDSGEAGDGVSPLSVNLPYADEKCDLVAELSKSEGKQVVGLSYGEQCFNYCFPEGRELETMIVPAADGRPALRVFWEQW